jgi:phosphomannomutase
MNDQLNKLKAAIPIGVTASRALQNPWTFIASGAVVILLALLLLLVGSSRQSESEEALAQAATMVEQVKQASLGFRRVLEDEQVQALAALALEDPGNETRLHQYLAGRMDNSVETLLFDTGFEMSDPAELGTGGYIILDMLFSQKEGFAPLQVFDRDGGPVVAGVARIAVMDELLGYLFVTMSPASFTTSLSVDAPILNYIALEQVKRGMTPHTLKEIGDALMRRYGDAHINVPGTLFRVVVPQDVDTSLLSRYQKLLILALGGLLLMYGFVVRNNAMKPKPVLREDSEQIAPPEDSPEKSAEKTHEAAPAPDIRDGALNIKPETEPGIETEPVAEPEPESDPDVALPDLIFDPAKRRKRKVNKRPPVELTQEIFKAYDIRGIIGKTLDEGIAYKVGQAVGSVVLEQDAGPVVVARDGRHSGPDLLEGLIAGLVSTGCDVISIGMAPTGVLYYAAYEIGSGSGVMVTGSHNPPDYNGLKIMVGGSTLSGEEITGLYQRLVNGDVRVGRGNATEKNMLDAYRDRIVSDIQLARPLRVVVDSGNGIGGLNSADVLRSIGAEVLPLFDEVDGDFPNHHPDPSEPQNLRDLIECVELMNADLGVAFDGDADRLGVVTAKGEIIYSDRVMMLFSRDVLERVPGATIIYDVKCTGHLATAISEAGGKPVMYKTGHSLIKNRMKELDSPFSGEMSGHFFFGERWYGVDDGIYAAARLLEILAKDERTPTEVLTDLPSSVSTPELKAHMKEGENHAFIERFRKEAHFENATISKIDGLRADWEDGWGLVRASNTTPVVVLRFDAENKAALKRIQMVFRTQLMAVDETLSLPF